MITEVLTYVFGGTSLVSIVLFLIFYKQNKAMKNAEVEKSTNEVEGGKIANDMAQIDLGTHYLKSIIDASAMISEANKSIINYSNERKDGFEKLNKDIKEIKDDVKSIKTEQNLITKFLNGEYQDFKKKNTKKKTDD